MNALTSSIAHLATLDAAQSRHIVVITDGAAACNTTLSFPDYLETYDERVVATLETAVNDHDITTHIIGIEIEDALTGVGQDGAPEANVFEKLNAAAQAGGAALTGGAESFHRVFSGLQLAASLNQIFESILPCEVSLAGTDVGLPDAERVPHVRFTADEADVPYVTSDDCDTADGWTWIEEGQTATFCGQNCEDHIKSTSAFAAVYGCPEED